MFRSRFLLTAVVAVIAPAVSQAAFTMSLTQTAGANAPAAQGAVLAQGAFAGGNGNTLTIVDQNVPLLTVAGLPLNTIYDGNGTTGNIQLNQITTAGSNGTTPVTFGSFEIGFSGTRSSGPGGAMVVGTSSSSVVNIQNAGSGTATLVLTLTEDNFTLPVGTGIYNVENRLTILNISSTTNAAMSSTSSVNSNVGFPATTVGQSLNSAQLTAAQQAGSQPMSVFTMWDREAGNGSYTVTHTVSITLDAGASITFNALTNITPAPAPPGLVMLAGALPFAGLLRLRRRLAKPEATSAA